MSLWRDFSFPLNVYAALLEWSEGQVQYLHYGLFQSGLETGLESQLLASERLWAQLPPQGRVLEVGVGIGTTLQMLHARGYQVLGITPEPAQAAAVRARHGETLPLLVTRLEDMDERHGRFDVMLLQESAQYIQPLELFEAAERLLEPDAASLVLMDEFALRRDSEADFGLHLLPHFKALAKRFGWRLEHEEDVTPAARPTLKVLLVLLTRYRVRLQTELGVTSEELDALQSSLKRYSDCYERGVYGYHVLRLQRSALPTYRPRLIDATVSRRDTQPGRVAEVPELFQRVFGREMGAQELDWKYGQGRGRGVAMVQQDGTPQAYYGSLARDVLMFGQPAHTCQICDVMVAPDAHRHLARNSALFYQAAATFIEAEVGFARRYAFGFGFPTDRALKIAERLGLYQRVDEMVQLRWAPGLSSTLGGYVETVDLARVDADGSLDTALNALWQEMAQGFEASVLGVRDAAWLRYRYGCKPGMSYTGLLLRKQSGPGHKGLVVFRVHADHLEVLDMVGAPAQLPELMDVARHAAAASPEAVALTHVKFWVTASHAALLLREGDGATLDKLDLFVPANAHTAGVRPETLSGRWFLTAGDTDFR